MTLSRRILLAGRRECTLLWTLKSFRQIRALWAPQTCWFGTKHRKNPQPLSHISILTYTSLYPFEGCALHHAELPSIAGTSGTAALMAGNFGEELLSEPTYLREELWRTFVSYRFLAFHGQLQFCMFSFCLRLFKAFGMNDFLRSSRQGLP